MCLFSPHMDHNLSELILYHRFTLQHSLWTLQMAFEREPQGRWNWLRLRFGGAVVVIILISACHGAR